MAIKVRCISCGKASKVKDDLAGKKMKCACGAVLTVSAAPEARTCAGCGIDVTNVKRTKDSKGSYFCEVCWAAKLEAAKVGRSANATEDIVYYPCYSCANLCTPEELNDPDAEQTVCKKCWAAANEQSAQNANV